MFVKVVTVSLNAFFSFSVYRLKRVWKLKKVVLFVFADGKTHERKVKIGVQQFLFVCASPTLFNNRMFSFFARLVTKNNAVWWEKIVVCLFTRVLVNYLHSNSLVLLVSTTKFAREQQPIVQEYRE